MAQTELTALNLQAADPPVAPKYPTVLRKHAEKRVDDYYWLRHKQDPGVFAYLQAENAYAAAVTKPLKP